MRVAFNQIVQLLLRANPEQDLDSLLNDELRCGLIQATCPIDGSSEWVQPGLNEMYTERGIKSIGGRQARTILRVRNRGRATTLHSNRSTQRDWLETEVAKSGDAKMAGTGAQSALPRTTQNTEE